MLSRISIVSQLHGVSGEASDLWRRLQKSLSLGDSRTCAERLEERTMLSAIAYGTVDLEQAPSSASSGLPGWIVFADDNRDGVRNTTESWTRTRPNGEFDLAVPGAFGIARIAIEVPQGWASVGASSLDYVFGGPEAEFAVRLVAPASIRLSDSAAAGDAQPQTIWLSVADAGVTSWHVAWGDNTFSTVSVAASTLTTTLQHVYAVSGQFPIVAVAKRGTEEVATATGQATSWTRDTSFGSAGGAVSGVSALAVPGVDVAAASWRDPQDRLVVVGTSNYSISSPARDVIVARYLPNGTLDTTFGDVVTGGIRSGFTKVNVASKIVESPPGQFNDIRSVDEAFRIEAVTNVSGEVVGIYVAGVLRFDGLPRIFVLKLSTSGQKDTSFGTDEVVLEGNPPEVRGYSLIAVDAPSIQLDSFKVHADGTISLSARRIASISSTEVLPRVYFAKLTAAGKRDTSFSTSGVLSFTLPASILALHDIGQQPDLQSGDITDVLTIAKHDGGWWIHLRFIGRYGPAIINRTALLRVLPNGTLSTPQSRLDLLPASARVSAGVDDSTGLIFAGVRASTMGTSISPSAALAVWRVETSSGFAMLDGAFSLQSHVALARAASSLQQVNVGAINIGLDGSILLGGSGTLSAYQSEEGETDIEPMVGPVQVHSSDTQVAGIPRVAAAFFARLGRHGNLDTSVNGTGVHLERLTGNRVTVRGVESMQNGIALTGDITPLELAGSSRDLFAMRIKPSAQLAAVQIARPRLNVALTQGDSTIGSDVDRRNEFTLTASAVYPSGVSETIDTYIIDWGDGSDPSRIDAAAVVTKKVYPWADRTYQIRVYAFDGTNGTVLIGNPNAYVSTVLAAVVGTFTLDVTYRDFRQALSPDSSQWHTVPNHVDFGTRSNSTSPIRTRLVGSSLVDGRPTFLSSYGLQPNGQIQPGEIQIENEFTFAEWFDGDERSKRVDDTVRLASYRRGDSQVFRLTGVPSATQPNQPAYTRNNFYPLDGRGWQQTPGTGLEPSQLGLDGQLHNFLFTTEIRQDFIFRASDRVFFEFVGDDDVWVFINGQLAVDLGGLHGTPARGEVTISATNSFGMVDGEVYELAIFHAERKAQGSQFDIVTNFPFTDGVRLEESSRFVTEAVATAFMDVKRRRSETFVANSVELMLADFLRFDGSSTGGFADTFEVSLIDPETRESVIPTISGGGDAFFTASERVGASSSFATMNVRHATGVAYSDESIRVDISSLAPDKVFQLVVRLVNNDRDGASNVTLDAQLQYHAASISTAALQPSRNSEAMPSRLVNFNQLVEVTGSLDVTFTHTHFNRMRGDVFAEFSAQVRDDSPIVIHGPLIAVVDNVRLRSSGQSVVAPLAADGYTPAGKPYFDVSRAAFSQAMQSLNRGDVFDGPDPAVIAFRNELWSEIAPGQQFDFDLRFYAAMNSAPVWRSRPVELAELGSPYAYFAQAVDAENDALRYGVLSGPDGLRIDDAASGMVTWAAPQLGAHVVRLAVWERERPEVVVEQSFTITVLPSIPNRPPSFVTDPIVAATALRHYAYDADAIDPDFGDVVTYALRSVEINGQTSTVSFVPGADGGYCRDSETGLIVRRATGSVEWTPPERFAGRIARITLEARDGSGITAGVDTQIYDLAILPTPGNNPPSVISRPDSQYTAWERTNSNVTGLSQHELNVSLAQGQQSTPTGGTLTFDVPESAVSTDVLFLVDQSGSMGGDILWLTARQGNSSQSTIERIDAELELIGVKNNRFGLIGFGSLASASSGNAVREYLASVGPPENPTLARWATSAELTSSLASSDVAVSRGEQEWGHAAIRHAIEGQYTQPGVPSYFEQRNINQPSRKSSFVIVLISDEGAEFISAVGAQARWDGSPDPTYQSIRDLLADSGALLHVMTAAEFAKPTDYINDAVIASPGEAWNRSTHLIGKNVRSAYDTPVANFPARHDEVNGAWEGVATESPVTLWSQSVSYTDSVADAWNETGIVEFKGISLMLGDRGRDHRGDAAMFVLDARRQGASWSEAIDYTFVEVDAATSLVRFGRQLPDGTREYYGESRVALETGFTQGNEVDMVFPPYAPMTMDVRLDRLARTLTLVIAQPDSVGRRRGSVTFADVPHDFAREPQTGENASKWGIGVVRGWAAFNDLSTPYRNSSGVPLLKEDIDVRPEDWELRPGSLPSGTNANTWNFLGVNREGEGFRQNFDSVSGDALATWSIASGAELWKSLPGVTGSRQPFQQSPESTYLAWAFSTGGYAWNLTVLRGAGTDPSPTQLNTRTAFTGAFTQTLAQQILERYVTLVPESRSGAPQLDPNVVDVAAPTITSFVTTGGIEMLRYAFPVTLTGDGGSHDFNLNLYQGAASTLNVQPDDFASVTISGEYSHQFVSIDPDGDSPLVYSWDGPHPSGATLTSDGLLRWLPPRPSAPTSEEFRIRVSDGRGGVDTFAWRVDLETINPENSVAPNGDPEIISPGATQLEAEVNRPFAFQVVAIDPDNDRLFYSVTNSELLQIDRLSGYATWTPRSLPTGHTTHLFEIRVSDGRGGYDTQVVRVELSNASPSNEAPNIVGTLPSTAFIDVDYVFDLNAVDLQNDAVTFSLVAAPEGMSIDPVSGVGTWRPEASQLGNHTIRVRATDSADGVNERVFQVQVRSSNNAPTLDVEIPSHIGVDDLLNEELRAYDPDGDQLTFRLLSGPDGAGVILDGDVPRLRWQVSAPRTPGMYHFVLAVEDGRGGADRREFTIAATQSSPPRITSRPGIAVVDVEWTYDVVFELAAGQPQNVTIALDNAPSYLSVDASAGLQANTRRIRGTPPNTLPIDFNIRLTHGDTVQTQRVRLQPYSPGAVQFAPVISSLPPGSAVVGVPWTYAVRARDPDGGPEPLTFSLVQADVSHPIPSGLQIDSVTGLVTWTTPTAGSYPFVVRVRDRSEPGSQTDGAFQYIGLNVYESGSPQITSASRVTSDVGTAFSFLVEVNDFPEEATTTPLPGATYELVGAVPPGLHFGTSETRHELLWSEPQLGRHDVVVRVVDRDGNVAEQTLSIVIRDPASNVAPNFIDATPRDVTTFTAAFSYQFSAADANFDEVTFMPLENVGSQPFPTGMTVSSAGRLLWSPGSSIVRGQTYHYRVRVSDGVSTTHRDFSVRVVSNILNVAPEIEENAPGIASLGSLFSHQFQATDADGDSVSWALASSPPGVTINPTTGELSWLPHSLGEHELAIQAFDGMGGRDLYSFRIVIQAVNVAPQFTTTPGTLAALDSDYVYISRARDLESGPLTFMIDDDSAGRGMTVMPVEDDPRAARVVWPRSNMNLGSYPVSLRVRDSLGAYDDQTFTVVVLESARASIAPVFEPLAELTAVVGADYVYDFKASWPADAERMVIANLEGGTNVTLARVDQNAAPTDPDFNRWRLTFTPSASGSHTIRLRARVMANGVEDALALPAYQDINLLARTNEAPTLAGPVGPVEATVGSVVQLRFVGSDVDVGDTLIYEIQAPVNVTSMSINSHDGTLVWDTAGASVGTTAITVRVRDRAGRIATHTTSVQLTADVDGPTVRILTDATRVDPDDLLQLFVQAQDTAGIDSIALEVFDGPITENEQPIQLLDVSRTGEAWWRVPLAQPQNGIWTLRARAFDTNGLQGIYERQIFARVSNGADPQILIDSPTMGEVLVGSSEVFGQIVAQQPFSYYIEVSHDYEQSWVRVTEPLAVTVPDGNVFRVTGSLGRVDATLLRNGKYVVRVHVEQPAAGGVISHFGEDVDVRIHSDLKVGNFSLSFVDGQLNLPGMPLTVRRSYDTLDLNQNTDFGWGWRLDLATASLAVSSNRDVELPIGGNYPAFDSNTRLDVVLPDGTPISFHFQPRFIRTIGGGFGPSIDIYTPAFVAESGVSATLSPMDDRDIEITFGDGAGQNTVANYWMLWDAGSASTPYNPAYIGVNRAYLLTLDDGTTYELDADSGRTRAIRDALGNRIAISDQGFETFDPTGTPIGRMQIERTNGRITRIDLRSSYSGSDRYLAYSYDSAGRLSTFTNELGETVTYKYELAVAAPYVDRYLTKIVDSRNVNVATMVYEVRDGSLRLTEIIDANGQRAQIGYDFEVDGHSGVVATVASDASGAQTIVWRNHLGDVVRKIVQIGSNSYQLEVTQYDEYRRVVRQSKPLGGLVAQHIFLTDQQLEMGNAPLPVPPYDRLEWALALRYDGGSDRVVEMVDGIGGVTTYTYTDAGDIASIASPDGSVVRNVHESSTRLLVRSIETLSDNRTRETVNDYNADRQLIRTRFIDEYGRESVLTETEYDARGLIAWTRGADARDVFGQAILSPRTYYVYNVDGDQIGSYRHVSGRTLLERAWIDAIGRTVQSGTYNLPGELTLDVTDFDSDWLVRGTAPSSTVRTEYYSSGSVKSTIDEFGAETRTYYDKRGLTTRTVSQERDADGQFVDVETWMVYDGNGRQIFISDPFSVAQNVTPFVAGSVTEYDDAGRVTKVRRVLDVYSRLQVPDSFAAEWYFERNFDTNNIGEVTVRETSTKYDVRGRVQETLESLVGESFTDLKRIFSYDAADRRTEVRTDIQNPIGAFNTSRNITEYDAGGRIQRTRELLGIDPATNAEIWRDVYLSYDANGRRVAERHAADPANPDDDVISRTQYDSFGRVAKQVDPLGRINESVYDSAGRLIQTRLHGSNSALLAVYSYVYDAQGNRTRMYDPNAHNAAGEISQLDRYTGFEYDEFSRQVTRTLPLGSLSAASGDFAESQTYGRLSIAEIPQSELGASVMDGQLQSKVDLDGNSTHYFYDNTRFGRGRVARVEHRTKGVSPADSPTESFDYVYDEFGRVTRINHVSKTYEIDRVTLHEYDDVGRLTSVKTEDANVSGSGVEFQELVAYTYDKADRIATMETPQGTTTYRYDSLNRLMSASWLSEERNVDGTPKTSASIDYTRDEGGRLTRSSSVLSLNSGFLTPSLNVTHDYQYDFFDRVVSNSVFAGGNNGLVYAKFAYTYDKAGNKLTAREWWTASTDGPPFVSQTFQYDDLNRLVSERSTYTGSAAAFEPLGYLRVYTYDRAGNRISNLSDTASTKEYSESVFDANDRLISEQVWSGLDSSGPLLRRAQYVWSNAVEGGSSRVLEKRVYSGAIGASPILEESRYTYSARGHLLSIIVDSDGDGTAAPVTTSNRYDHAGLRYEQFTDRVGSDSDELTRYLYESLNPTGYAQALEEWRAGVAELGALKFLRGAVAGLDVFAVTLSDERLPLALIYDGGPVHASVRAIVENVVITQGSSGSFITRIAQVDGQQTQQFFYTAYGEMVTPTGYATAATALTSLLYRGEMFDAASRLQYLRARHYDASSGRFTSLDPYAGNDSNPLSYHKYLYAHANPVMGVDPSGMFTTAELGAAMGQWTNVMNFSFRVLDAYRKANRVIDIVQAVQTFARIANGDIPVLQLHIADGMKALSGLNVNDVLASLQDNMSRIASSTLRAWGSYLFKSVALHPRTKFHGFAIWLPNPGFRQQVPLKAGKIGRFNLTLVLGGTGGFGSIIGAGFDIRGIQGKHNLFQAWRMDYHPVHPQNTPHKAKMHRSKHADFWIDGAFHYHVNNPRHP